MSALILVDPSCPDEEEEVRRRTLGWHILHLHLRLNGLPGELLDEPLDEFLDEPLDELLVVVVAAVVAVPFAAAGRHTLLDRD